MQRSNYSCFNDIDGKRKKKIFAVKKHTKNSHFFFNISGIVESNNVLYSFLNGLFEEGTNISTTTKRALIISVNKVNEEELYPFSIGNRCIIYGERLNVYVHPIYNDHEFLPIYEPSTVHPNEKDIQPVLHEIFGDEFDINSSAMISSAQLSSPKNQRNEIELIRDLNHNSHGRDLLSEFKLAVEEKKKQQQKQRTLTKSKPTKIVSTTTLLEEKKIVVKKLIKEALSGSVKEDKSINQLIYSSIRDRVGDSRKIFRIEPCFYQTDVW